MSPTIAPWAFVLAVHDLDKSAGYYRDVLGFKIQWAEADDWRLVARDHRIVFGQEAGRQVV